jgi:hypothetical protein
MTESEICSPRAGFCTRISEKEKNRIKKISERLSVKAALKPINLFAYI